MKATNFLYRRVLLLYPELDGLYPADMGRSIPSSKALRVKLRPYTDDAERKGFEGDVQELNDE